MSVDQGAYRVGGSAEARTPSGSGTSLTKGGALSDIDVLETVLAKDAALLAAVSPEQLSAPTPCPEYDVQALVNQVTPGVRGGG